MQQTSTLTAGGAIVPRTTVYNSLHNVVQIQVQIKTLAERSQQILQKYNESKIYEYHILDDSLKVLYERKL